MTMDQLIARLTALRDKHGNIRVELLTGMVLVTPYVHYARKIHKTDSATIRIEAAQQRHLMEENRRRKGGE